MLVWTYALPEIPAEGEPRSTGVHRLPDRLPRPLDACWRWSSPFRLWRAGRAAPSVARRRLQLLAVGVATITAALLLAGAGGEDGSTLSRSPTTLLATISALAFLLGLAPPPMLRLAWRRPENQRLQAAIASLMGAATEEEVAEQVAEPMAAIVGARAVALLDPAGRRDRRAWRVRGDARAAAASTARRSSSSGAPFGTLVVWTSPYAPYFGGEELRLLRTLGA